MSSEEKKGTAAALLVSLIWGLSFVAARIALATLTPILLATIRFIIASLVFAPFLVRELSKGYSISRDDLVEMAKLGFLSISIYFWLQYTGVKYTGAGVSAIIVIGFIPILTGLISKRVLKEPFGPQKLTGTLLGFTGVTIITIPGLMLETINTWFYLGIATLLGNAVCFSLYSALSRKLMQRIKKPVLVTGFVTIFGTLALLPMSLTSDWSLLFKLTTTQWISIVFLATVCSGGGYFLWNYALSRLEAVKAAVILYIEPLVAILGETILIGTTPDLNTLIGGTIIMIGAWLTSRSRK